MYKCGQRRPKDSTNMEPHPGYQDELCSKSLQVCQFSKIMKFMTNFPELSTEQGSLTPTLEDIRRVLAPNSTRISKDGFRHGDTQKEHGSRGKGCLCFQKNLLEATTCLGRNGDHISALDFRHTL